MFLSRILSVLFLFAVSCVLSKPMKDETSEMLIEFAETQVTGKDDYVCEAKPIEASADAYVVGFEIRANRKCVHHVVVAACAEYVSDKPIWDCKLQQGHICKGRSIVFGAWDGWSKSHGPAMFPDDVSVNMGSSSSLKYTVLQIHYFDPTQCLGESPSNVTLHLAPKSRQNTFQVTSLGTSGYIPAKSLGFSSETACMWQGVPIQAYGYGIHTHDIGKLVEAYVVRNGRWIPLGGGKPVREKERFDILNGPVTIRPGDIIAARCIHDNKSDKNVYYGHGGDEEMCNYDIDFKYPNRLADVYTHLIPCFKSAQTFSWKDFVGSQPSADYKTIDMSDIL